ncbi:MAG: spiro-SPASM protein [Spirochaeta sp.]|nr:spiro-SPASM protein [Spirochaeta sp.]
MSIIATDMRNIAVLNGIKLSNFAWEKIINDKTALQAVYNYSRQLPEVEKVVILLSNEQDSSSISEIGLTDLQAVFKENWTVAGLLSSLQELSYEYDHIFYLFADCPLLDNTISAEMFGNHVKYFADYTFADGYPYGLTPEIIRSKTIPALAALAGKAENEPARDTIFEVIKKDINAFDIETEISPIDLRMLRVSLATDSKRNFILLKRLIGAGARDSLSTCKILQDKAEYLRTLPSFFNIQIVEGCPQLCSYCPYPQVSIKSTGKKGEMTLSNFQKIVDQIEEFCGDAVISISLWGEPSYHSSIIEIVSYVQNKNNIRLLIETSGLGWQESVLRELKEKINEKQKPLEWIVSLDAHTPAVYGALRGEGFAEAKLFIKLLMDYFPEQVYVQAVRMKSNEDDLEIFFREWKKINDKVIIQKYDSFCGLLPDHKVTDLSPIKRFPCWHIKRDVNILLDGSVPLCREDISAGHILGNVLKEDLEKVWENGKVFYSKHLMGEYPDICLKCDEYYTYNF